MDTYIVKRNQNIFDIAMQLSGSVEGVFDLLISNTGINLFEDISAGTTLNYHPDFVINSSIVSEFGTIDLVVANNENEVYFKDIQQTPKMIIKLSDATTNHVEFAVRGDKTMIIDWGDNTSLETIEVKRESLQTISHYYDDTVDERIIQIYGDYRLLKLSITGIEGEIYQLCKVYLQNFVYTGEGINLEWLALAHDITEITLTDSNISDAQIEALLKLLESNYTSDTLACSIGLPRKPNDTCLALIEKLKEFKYSFYYIEDGSLTITNI